MTKYQLERVRQILEHYGEASQYDIFVEECAEAIQAVQKIKRSKPDDMSSESLRLRTNLAEEVADVLITANQIRMCIGESVVDMAIDIKLDRQFERMKEEK